MNIAILLGSLLLFIAVLSSKISSRFGIPALLVFILVGILAGTDGIGNINFDDFEMVNKFGIIALAYILFMGGITMKPKDVKPVFAPGLSLATVGVFLTAIIVGLISYTFLDFTIFESLLLGGIISSTDAAAVFSVLRAKSISLRGNLKPLLEFESGSNDPMAVFLTVIFIAVINSEVATTAEFVVKFIQQMGLGILLGFLFGKFAVILINKIKLGYDGLYLVLTISLVAFSYSSAELVGANGFMCVYVCGLTMSTMSFVHKKNIITFHDGIAWVMQILMFLVLGLLVFIKNLLPFAFPAILVSTILIAIARPIAVFVSLIPFKYSVKEKLMISWVGLRGAAPIVLATFPLIAGVEKSSDIFNIVFFVVLISVLIQGTTIPTIAKLLKVDAPILANSKNPLALETDDNKNELIEFIIPEHSKVNEKRIYELGMPKNSLIAMILRDDKYIIPSGTLQLKANDVLYILIDKDNQEILNQIFAKNEN